MAIAGCGPDSGGTNLAIGPQVLKDNLPGRIIRLDHPGRIRVRPTGFIGRISQIHLVVENLRGTPLPVKKNRTTTVRLILLKGKQGNLLPAGLKDYVEIFIRNTSSCFSLYVDLLRVIV